MSQEQEISQEEVKTNVSIHKFQETIQDRLIFYLVTKFSDKCLFIWVGDSSGEMNEMVLSLNTPYDKGIPATTTIFGSGESSRLAMRLTKKLSKPVYVSFNLSTGISQGTFLQEIENRLFCELGNSNF